MTPIGPLPQPSGPDRCFLVLTEHFTSKSSLPETSFKLESSTEPGPQNSIKWQPSVSAERTTSFLDLPKEMRDLVYVEICGDFKREGYKWKHTAPPCASTRPQQRKAIQRETPLKFSNCASMRTCKQVHAEFAEVLYSVPIQLKGVENGINIVPISPVYAPAVRSVLVVYNSYYRSWKKNISDLLHTFASLSKVFPDLATPRVGWWKHYQYQTQNGQWTAKDWGALIKTVRREASVPLQTPWNAELVELVGSEYGSRSWPHDWIEVENHVAAVKVEALMNARSKPKEGTTPA